MPPTVYVGGILSFRILGFKMSAETKQTTGTIMELNT